MIKLGLDIAAAALLSIMLVFMFGVWLCERAGRGSKQGTEDDAPGDIRQCPYCRRICVEDKHKKVVICPVCKSYFDEEAI